MALFPSFRCAWVLLVCSCWLGCSLERSGKSACRTDHDCNPGRVCSLSLCVAREDVFDASAIQNGAQEDGESPAPREDEDAEVPADSGDEAEPAGGGGGDGPDDTAGAALEPPGPSGAEPGACGLDAASATCAATEACDDPDFDLQEGACTRHDDCAGVSACDPGACVDGTRTFSCKCPIGFMAQGKACLPATSCASFGCSDRCVSGLAKPTCACADELVLASDDRSCKAGAWSEPMVLTRTGTASGVALAVSRTGPAMVLYQQYVADVLELRSRSFRGNAWGESVLLEPHAYDSSIAVGIDDFGRSTAIFESADPAGRHQFWAYRAQDSWQKESLLDGSVSDLEQPSSSEGLAGVKIATNGPGYVYAIWRHERWRAQRGDTYPVYVNELSPDKGTNAVARLLAPDSSTSLWAATNFDLSVERGGLAATVWTPAAGGADTPPAMIDAFPDRAWTGAKPVDPDNASPPALRASVSSPGGTTHVVWISDAGVYHRELFSHEPSTVRIAPLTGTPGFIASASAGRSVTALWTDRVDGSAPLTLATGSLYASTKVADGAWSAPATLQTATVPVFPSVRVASDGAAVASWSELREGIFSLHLSRYSPAAETWSAPMQVNAEGTNVIAGAVGMDEGHRIMVAWSEWTADGTHIFLRRFE